MMDRDSQTLNDRIGKHGFTMIELLVAMAMAGIVLAAVVALYSGLTRSYTTETARAAAQQDIRGAMMLMVGDIRMAGLDPTGQTNAGFKRTAGTDISFTADLDYSGGIDVDGESIRYFLNGRQLRQEDGDDALNDSVDSSEILLDNVTAFTFTYLDANEAPLTADPSAPAIVVITLTVQEPAGRQGFVTRSLTKQIRIRNA
ncbi:hypothetical protein DSCO28_06680 [Desulfosarcina ovata subsp. sediminis]|uniref:Prepilin-type N-terminal cleavage/methylation domain-containing protein n=1 Tax=Desulfosarcina ovata subsp. sediminis TaxID=885957 RepID=A0A5K7ZDM4_9BACT|nr:prepilin-type N-terminal cleavage/methylation domain-containing protein [Desulfosarcina ovata]BBO80102.1 hypothetical protein DSCO28_06680 [Desulfosarcina ovata subsp. sediminis]